MKSRRREFLQKVPTGFGGRHFAIFGNCRCGTFPTNSAGCSKEKGFSLIELLVTIMVIVVLALISFNLIGKAREAAQLSQNTSNLRSLGIASLNYASANGGKLPQATISGKPRRTTGNQANSNSPPRQLLGRDFPGGVGAESFVDSADVFYGPFTPKFDENRQKGRFFSPQGSTDLIGPFKIGYIFYSLTGVTDGSEPPREPLPYNLANDDIYGENNPRTPLYSDVGYSSAHIEESGFHSSRFMTVHLDGSVSVFDAREIQQIGGITGVMYLTSGARPRR